jgi:hypothetical protein
MNVLRNRAALVAALLICGCLFAFAGDGLGAYFTPDDMMNLYFAWSAPALQADRPVGALFYKGMFAVFGLHSLPYRLAAFALLLANLGLLYAFCVRLARSREAAALACLLAAYQAHLADLYYSTGTIYDLLCFFFLFSALVYYLKIRAGGSPHAPLPYGRGSVGGGGDERGRDPAFQAGTTPEGETALRSRDRKGAVAGVEYPAASLPSWRETMALLALYALALGSKEMAATLPALILLYELIYHRGEGWRRWRFALLCLPVAAACAALKTVGAHRMTANPAYAFDLSLHAFLAAWRHYLDLLVYGAFRVTTLNLALFFAAALALAWLARRREMLFGVGFAFIAMLPIVFVAERGLFAAYVALPGWYLYGGSALAACRDWAARGFPRAAAWLRVKPEQAALFLVVLAALVPLHRGAKPQAMGWVPEAHGMVRGALVPLLEARPALARGAKVLILSDPYPKDEWMLTFLFRLAYRDNELRVDRAKVWPLLAEEPERSKYQRLFAIDSQGLREVSR